MAQTCPWSLGHKGQFLKPILGDFGVPDKPAAQMQAQRGVGGYWFAWPGVDTSSAAATIIYAHGGEACGAERSCLEHAAAPCQRGWVTLQNLLRHVRWRRADGESVLWPCFQGERGLQRLKV